MEIFEITGFATGVSQAGVNYLQPSDSFQNISNGFIYRQVLQSRQGAGYFAPQLANASRVFGIFEFIHPDSTKELIAIDKNFLYKYNTVTGNFDQIPFAGSLVGYTGFSITSNEFYVSGTAYPTAQFLSNGANNPKFTPPGTRFVFTGDGFTPTVTSSTIFFYDGTSVYDFTNISDNPNYADPPEGKLSKATYVTWFNERLNFISPTIAGIEETQGILYSGIRDNSGNGDKFNVAGSGLFLLDTYEYITGFSILGQILSLNLNRSNYTLEKTTDAFNPYFSRKVPSVLGTDAKFSAVSWNDIVKSHGKTGILGTDGRQTLRVDNKIPNFTSDEVDEQLFLLTYGGFDRVNNQFIWSYKEPNSMTGTQNRVLVNNYEENTWSIYDQRFSVFGQTDIGFNLPWDSIDASSGNESWAQWDTTEELWDKIGFLAATQKTLAGDDNGFIYDISSIYNDYFTDITGITQAPQAILTVDPSSFLPGDRVVIQDVTGMVEINNFNDLSDTFVSVVYTVVAATTTSISLDVNSTNFSPYISGGTISKLISFYAETIPFNPYRSIGRRCFISHVEFYIDNNGGSLLVDVYANEDYTPFKTDVLLLPNNSLENSRQWITMVVDNEADFMTFVLKQESPASQLRLTSMRLHCQPGGYTSG